MNYNIYKIKNYQNYNEEEILDLLKLANNQYQYDSVIDRLYFYNNENNKNFIPRELNIKSVRTIYLKEKRVKHDNDL